MKTHLKFTRSLVLAVAMTLFLSINTSQAQEWLKYLPKYKLSQHQYTLKDYQKAFYTYQKKENLKAGEKGNKGENEEDGDYEKFKRWEWFWQSRVNPVTGAFPKESAYDVYQEYLAAHPDFKSVNTNDWKCLGAFQTDITDQGMGRVNCVAFSPVDTSILYVGSASGGVWKSYDGGTHWSPTGDFNAVLGVADLVVVNDNGGQDIVYLATGDRDHWDTPSEGVLKSTDGGTTWKKTGLFFETKRLDESHVLWEMAYKLLLDPLNHNTLYAATSAGVYKTIDAGETWQKINKLVFRNIQFPSGSNSRIIGSTNHGEIYYSPDAGATWNLALSDSNGRHTEIAVAPDSSNIVYAVMANPQGCMEGFFRSDDTAKSFTLIMDSLNLLSQDYILGSKNPNSNRWAQGWYDLSIAVDPHDANRVFVGGINTWMTWDGGKNWELKGFGSYCPLADTTHVDKHNLAFQENTHALFECNDGGIYKSNDDGTHWEDISNGLVIGQLYTLGTSRTVPGEVLTGLQDNGCKSLSGGNWTNVQGGDVMECLIDYTDVNTQYASEHCGYILRTKDHWKTAKLITGGIDMYHRAWYYKGFAIDPKDHNTLYAAYGDVYKSTDQGDHWNKISTFNNILKNDSFPDHPEADTVFALYLLSVAPSNSNVMYTMAAISYHPDHLFKTTDGGKNWEDMTGTLPIPILYQYWTWNYLTVKYDDPNTLWIVGMRFLTKPDKFYVLQSSDGGKSWKDISTSFPKGIPINWLVQNKLQSPLQLFAATDVGVFVYQKGVGWSPYNNGLPHVVVDQLKIRYDTLGKAKLYAATFGRGLWEVNLPESSTGIHRNAENNTVSLRIYPNPAKDNTTFEINNLKSGSVKIEVINLAGKRIDAVYEKVLQTGTFRFKYNLSHFAPGLYIIRVIHNSSHNTFLKNYKLVIEK